MSCWGASKHNNSCSSSGRGWHRSWFASDYCYCLRLRCLRCLRLLHSDMEHSESLPNMELWYLRWVMLQGGWQRNLLGRRSRWSLCLAHSWEVSRSCAAICWHELRHGTSPGARGKVKMNRLLTRVTQHTVTEVWNAAMLISGRFCYEGMDVLYVIVLCFVEVKEARRAHRRGRRRGKDSVCMSRNCSGQLRHTETYSKLVARMLYMHKPTGCWRVRRRWARGF